MSDIPRASSQLSPQPRNRHQMPWSGTPSSGVCRVLFVAQWWKAPKALLKALFGRSLKDSNNFAYCGTKESSNLLRIESILTFASKIGTRRIVALKRNTEYDCTVMLASVGLDLKVPTTRNRICKSTDSRAFSFSNPKRSNSPILCFVTM